MVVVVVVMVSLGFGGGGGGFVAGAGGDIDAGSRWRSRHSARRNHPPRDLSPLIYSPTGSSNTFLFESLALPRVRTSHHKKQSWSLAPSERPDTLKKTELGRCSGEQVPSWGHHG